MKMIVIEKFNKKSEAQQQNEEIISEIYRLSQALERAYQRFELQSDSNLVDATIFEIEAIKARYRYMLCLAKEKNIRVGI